MYEHRILAIPDTSLHLINIQTSSAVRTTAVVVALTVCTIFLRRAVQAEYIGAQDEGILLVYPDLILRGYRPYVDFAALYSPGGFYFIAGVFKAFGSSVVVESGVALLYWCLIIIALFLIGLRVTRATGILAVITALAFIRLSGCASSLCGVFLHAICTIIASSATTPNTLFVKGAATLAGVLAGMAVWVKQDLGIVAVLGTFGSFALGSPRRQRAGQTLRFLLGLSIPVFCFIIFTLLIGPASVIDSLVLDPLHSAPGRAVPIRLSLDLVVVVVCIIVQLYGTVIVRSPSVPENLIRLSRGIATTTVFLALSLLHRFSVGDISWVGAIVVSLTLVSAGITSAHLRTKRRRVTVVMTSCFFVELTPVLIRHITQPPVYVPISWMTFLGRSAPWFPNDNSLGACSLR